METEKLNITNLVIEITRRCNLTCEHCLRGDAQNINIKPEYITALLEKTGYISLITFTGGEPGLNPPAIRHFINECNRLHVGVGNFYIATNGTIASNNYISVIMDLYLLCDDNEISSLDISNDQFHDTDINVICKLEIFRFAHKKYTKETRFDSMINEGRYKDNFNDGRELREHGASLEDNGIYLNCNGDIVNGCDYSYENQEQHIISNVKQFSSDAINEYNKRFGTLITE